jgi:sterol desaturase/sphingolipid hydroxylase (fatty acid hydroxylase superfamily)
VTSTAFAGLILGGQLVLIAMDLLDGRRHRNEIYGADRLALPTVTFLGVTIVVYGALQVAGLALAPTGEELLARAQSVLLRGGESAGFESTPAALALSIGILAFYAGGFWDYVVHRFVNHNPALWFTHEYHHLPTRVAVYMPGICVRPLAVVAVLPATAATILTVCLLLRAAGLEGFELTGVLHGVVLAQVTVLGTSHSAFLRRLPAAHRLLRPLGITTPQEHWLHHARDLQGNFGNFTTLWDRLFGTYLDPLDPANGGRRAGLAYDQDFLGVLTLGRWKLPQRFRDYCRIGRYCHLEPAVAR